MSLFDRIIQISRKKSPWFYCMNSGSCNGCDIEIGASLCPRYDPEQIGAVRQGSPKHADILLVSGPVTRRTQQAVLDIYAQIPEPKAVVAVGSCPITGNVFVGSPTVTAPLEELIPVDVFVPGCPPDHKRSLQGLRKRPKLLLLEKQKRQRDNMELWFIRLLIALLIWPGLIVSALLGWYFAWMIRKLTARLQGRQGPPFYQPFFDFVKLISKVTIVPDGISPIAFYGLPVVAVVSIAFALAMLPLPGNIAPSFAGDLVLFLYLLEMPAICTILAGYSSKSLYGQVSSSREAVLLLGYNVPFLASVIVLAIQAKSFQLADIANQSWSFVHLLAVLAFLIALPARIRTNPFSIPNAEQEIVAGSTTEYNGVPLALFELAHELELVAVLGLFASLFFPLGDLAVGFKGLIYLAIGFATVLLISVLSTITARFKINQAFRFYWVWGTLTAAAAFVFALLW